MCWHIQEEGREHVGTYRGRVGSMLAHTGGG